MATEEETAHLKVHTGDTGHGEDAESAPRMTGLDLPDRDKARREAATEAREVDGGIHFYFGDTGHGEDAESAPRLMGLDLSGREKVRRERRERWFRLACEVAGLLASIATIVTLILVFLA